MRKHKNNRIGPVLKRQQNALEKRITSQVYAWLLGKWESYKGWTTNDVLWGLCPYRIYMTREQFDELIHEMKTVEGWL